MSQTKGRDPTDHEVGYGRPPAHRRFRKGQSGNPGGRPRGMTAGRATALALKELFRPVTIREGGKLRKLPAIQAVLRSQVALAAKGNGPAQRTLFETACAIEKELAAQVPPRDDVRAKASDLEAARRIAAALMKVSRDDSL